MTVMIVLMVLMLGAAFWTVMCRSLLKSAIGLAVTSAAITLVMFRLGAPLAAVFELSVCAGLMTVIFVSTISMTKPLTHKEVVTLSKDRFKRFGYLPLVIAAVAGLICLVRVPEHFPLVHPAVDRGVRVVIWHIRHLDLFGQIFLIIAGAVGVVVLFEERRKDEW